MSDPPKTTTMNERIFTGGEKFAHEFYGGGEKWMFTVWSVAHMLFGMIAFKIGLSIWVTFAIHTAFEIFESSKYGRWFWTKIGDFLTKRKYDIPWSGYHGDSVTNTYGDTLSCLFGWWLGSRYLS